MKDLTEEISWRRSVRRASKSFMRQATSSCLDGVPTVSVESSGVSFLVLVTILILQESFLKLGYHHSEVI